MLTLVTRASQSVQMLILPGLPVTPVPTQAPFYGLLKSIGTDADRRLAVRDAGWRRSAVLGACVGKAHWLLTTARCVVPVFLLAAVHALHSKLIEATLKQCG